MGNLIFLMGFHGVEVVFGDEKFVIRCLLRVLSASDFSF